jgi:nitronate monooxygenase
MAGGPSTPELVAAVANAGGLGSLGAAYLSPEKIGQDITNIRKLTQRPFAVNLFSPLARQPLSGDVQAAINFLKPYHQQLGLDEPRLPENSGENFDQQLEVVCQQRVPVVSFTFGLLPEAAIARLQKQNTYLIGTATTVEEAKLLEQSGVDAVVGQGSEA